MSSPKGEPTFRVRRIACRDSLIDAGTSLDHAERWCDAWELEAALHGIGRSAEYWQDGRRWIDAQRTTRKTPPS